MRELSTAVLVSAALVACAAGCSPDGASSSEGGDAGPADRDAHGTKNVELEIGLLDEKGRFDPLERGERVRIEVGFQGLIFIDFALLGPERLPSRLSGVAEVRFAESDDDFRKRRNGVRFRRRADGKRVAERFRVPFSSLSAAVGSRITLVARLRRGEWRAHGRTTIEIAPPEDAPDASPRADVPDAGRSTDIADTDSIPDSAPREDGTGDQDAER
ncbi:MAG: hypothetical protein ABEL76_11280 [Bradymonadaceae bacterium]